MLLLCFSLFLLLNTAFARYFRQSTLLLLDKELYYSTSVTRVQITLKTSTNTGTSQYSQLSHKLPPLVHYKEVAYRRLSCMGKITKQAQIELITIILHKVITLKAKTWANR